MTIDLSARAREGRLRALEARQNGKTRFVRSMTAQVVFRRPD